MLQEINISVAKKLYFYRPKYLMMKTTLSSLLGLAFQWVSDQFLRTSFAKTLLATAFLLVGVSGFGQTTVLTDNFATASSGDHTTTGGSGTPWAGDANFPTVVNAFQAGGAIRIGASGAIGSITSKSVNLSTDGGNVKVTFDVKGWSTVEGSIKVTITGQASQTVTYTSTLTNSFETKSVSFTGGVAGSTVKIETTAKRAFIDNVKVETISACTAPTPTWITTPSTTGCPNTDQFYETQSGMTNYQWDLQKTAGVDYTIISGGTSTDNTMTVRFHTKGGNRVTVGYTSGGCASTTPALWDHTVNGVSIGPLAVQNIIAGNNGNQLNASEDGTVVSREWKYSTTSGGPYTSFSSPVTGVSYTPNFATAGTYYVVCESTFSSCTVISNEITINVTALPKPVITSAPTKTTTYGITSASYQITASNSPTSYAITSPTTLPAGFTYDAPTRTLTAADNTDAGTYVFTLTATNAAGTSDPFPLTWTQNKKTVTISGVTVTPKVYDQTTAATLNFSAATINTLLPADAGQVSISNTGYTANYNNKNVGNGKTVTIIGVTLTGPKAANYNLTAQPTATGNITEKDITISGIIANDKEYDTTTSVTFDTSGIVLNTIYSGDVVSNTVVGAFQTATVGNNKPVDITAITLAGTDGGNYQVNPLPTVVTANITKATPVISPASLSLALGDTKDLTTLVTSTNTITPLVFDVPVGNGIVSLPNATTIQADAIGNTTLTVTQAANANYNAASVTIPVIVEEDAAAIGDYKTINDGNWNEDANWQVKTASGWLAAPYPATGTTSTIWIKNKVTLNFGPVTFKNIVVTKTGEMTQNGSGGMTIGSNAKLLIKTGGVFINNMVTKFANNADSIFEIEDGGNFQNSYQSNPLVENLFLGKEIFHPNSNFIVKAVAANAFLTDFGKLSSYDAGSGNIGYFGNIIIDYTTGGGMDLIVGTTSAVVATATKITNGNLIFRKGPSSFRVFNGNMSVTSSSTAVPYTIGGNLIVESGFTSTITLRNTSYTAHLKVNKDFIMNGTGTFRLTGSVLTVASENLYIDGNLKLNDTSTFLFSTNVNNTSPTLSVYLKGDIEVATGATFNNANTAANNNANLYFISNGDGSTDALTQKIDIAPTTGSNAKINFSLIWPAFPTVPYVKLAKDLYLGTNSALNVRTNSTLDFGFDGNTALNVVAVGNGQTFTAASGSTLKITSPNGITTDANLGNVQTPVAGRTYSGDATYQYIGKGTQQVSGNGLPGAAGDKKVIVELDSDDVKFWATPEAGAGSVKRFTQNGWLEIRRGTVLDGQNPDVPSENYGRFADAIDTSANTSQSANLKMTGGRYVLYHSGYAMPHFSGMYDLTGGVIQFDGNDQSIRAPKTYLTVEVTGKKVGTPDGNITLKSISSPSAIDGSLTVKNGGEFLINNNSIVGDTENQTVTVESGAIFNTGDPHGFSGSNQTSIQPTIENINLLDNSNVEYSRAGAQTITDYKPLAADQSNLTTGGYYNLKISGDNGNLQTGTAKTISPSTTIYVRNDVEVATTARLIIDADKALIVNNKVINNGGAATNFIVESDGNLQQITNATNTGAISARRLLTLSDNSRKEYNFFSSPVADQDMKLIYGGVPANIQFVTVLNEATNMFVNATSADWSKKARGFAVKEPKTSYVDMPAESLLQNEVEYKGIPNNGAFPITITKSADNRGWNLLGNPYPSNIDLNALYKATENEGIIKPEIRFWDNRVNNTYVQYGGNYNGYSYAIYHAWDDESNPAPGGDLGENTGTPGTPSTIGDLRYAKVGQGFLVRAINSTATLSINNTLRTTNQPSSGFFGKSADMMKDRYRLQLITPSNLMLTQTVLYFNKGNNEFGIDDSKHPSSSASDAFYSYADEEKTIINGRAAFNTTDVVALGDKHYAAGTYKIRVIDRIGVFASGQSIYLKDKELGIVADLTAGDYTFTSNSGEYTNRFEIVYQPNIVLATDGQTKSSVKIYRDDTDFVVLSSEKAIGYVELYDASGRLIFTMKGRNSKELRFNAEKLANGMYVLKSMMKDGEPITKKIRK